MAQENDQTIFIWKNPKIPTQYVRKITASLCGSRGKYDWRLHPFFENMNETITAYKKYADNNYR